MNQQLLDEMIRIFNSDKEDTNSLIGNILSFREIGPKTRGDMGEIGICRFLVEKGLISEHVGKSNFRRKTCEEDLVIEIGGEKYNVSIKVYGADGCLQLSTDKEQKCYPILNKNVGENYIDNIFSLEQLFQDECFKNMEKQNVLNILYREEQKEYCICVFDMKKALKNTSRIEFISPKNKGKRKYPIYQFLDNKNNYICEVRYGGSDANALQRGIWTNSKKNKYSHFVRIVDWQKYEISHIFLENIVELICLGEPEQKKVQKFIQSECV